MKQKYPLSSALILPFILLGIASCNNERQVVPCDVDVDEILAPLTPNDVDSPEPYTFGTNNVPGFIFDNDFTTENPDVYVNLQNFTVLDVNPAISQAQFDFMVDQLEEYGFINDSFSLSPGEMESLQKSGLTFTEASAKVIDSLKSAFESQLDTINSYGSPFNIYFQIYPVYLDDKVVTYRQTAYSYTGGAHGMTTTYLKSYSLSTGQYLTFNDIVKESHQEMVREEVAAHMAYSYPIYENITTVPQYIDSLNVWLDNFSDPDKDHLITAMNFPVSDVALVKDGLAFVYQMYELTPGSDGCPVVVIPLRDIKGALEENLAN